MLAGGGILGPDAIPGEPAALDGLVGELRDAAGTVASIQGRISGEGLSGEWDGQAADAFRSSLNDLPGELGQLHNSFGTAADVLGAYAGALTEAQAQANWYARQIEQLENDLQGAQEHHARAQSAVEQARTSYLNASDPASKLSTQQALDRAGATAASAAATVEEYNGQLRTLFLQAHGNREAFERAAATCCAGLSDASNLGIKNSVGSWLDRNVVHGLPGKLIGGTVGVVEWTGKEIGDAADHVAKWAVHFKNDAEAFLAHPSWDTARALLEDVKGPLMIAGLVLGVAAIVFTGGAAAPFIVAAATDVVLANTAGDLVVAGGDAYEAEWGSGEEQRRARGQLLDDAESLGGDALDLHGAASAADDTAALSGLRDDALQSFGETGNTAYLDLASDAESAMTPTHTQALIDFGRNSVEHYGISALGQSADADLKLGPPPADNPKPSLLHLISLPSLAEAWT